MHVERSVTAGAAVAGGGGEGEGRGSRVAYLVWQEAGGEALLVDWDGLVPELAAVVERERLRPVWHARTDARRPEDEGDAAADAAAALAVHYPALRTAWYAGCGTLHVGGLTVDVVWTPHGGAEEDGQAGLSFVVGETAAFVGVLVAAAAARDERAAHSLEVVREYASAATLYPGTL
jgi:hypothetical protein